MNSCATFCCLKPHIVDVVFLMFNLENIKLPSPTSS